MPLQYILYVFFILSGILGPECTAEKVQYISTEHPKVTYFNPKYMDFVNLTARRYGRGDPLYYVGMHVHMLHPWANNVTVDIYFFEWLTNQYKRGFVEMHFKFCDLIQNDMFFGATMKQGQLDHPCPYLPGDYHLYNTTIPLKQIPPNFPFRKGRIYSNLTASDTNESIARGYIDMEIKEFNIRRKKLT